jgi:tetratricopeptide (TPR) repeat protein
LEAPDLGNWAVVKLELGHFEAAETLLKDAVGWASPRDTRYIWGLAEANLALVEYERGNAELAAAHAQASYGLGGEGMPPPSAALALAVLGLATDERGDGLEGTRRLLLGVLSRPAIFGMDTSYSEIFLARMSEREGKVDEALERLERAVQQYVGRDFFCHGRLELEKARLIGTRDREGGLALAREVRARAADAEAVLLLNKAEALIRELKRAEPAGATRSKGAVALAAGQASGRRGRARSRGTG